MIEHRCKLLVMLGLSITGCQAIATVDYTLVDAASCQPGLDLCGGQCRDLRTTHEHCGECNRNCFALGMECSNGSCVCSTGTSLCGSRCLETQSDRENCGACGRTCAPNEQCVRGICQACPQGQVSCSNRCVDVQQDTVNCGQCGRACASNEQCVGGICQACPQGQVSCLNLCVDVQQDTSNCGQCGRACASGSCLVGKCPEDFAPCGVPSTDVGAPGDKACGDNVCAAAELCCLGIPPGGSRVYAYCAATCGADVPAACDGPEDCPRSGEVCCGVKDLRGFYYHNPAVFGTECHFPSFEHARRLRGSRV